MKRIVLAMILGLSTVGLFACDSEADVSVKEGDIIKGNVDTSETSASGEYLYLPVLNYELVTTDSDYKMHYLTILYDENLAVVQLYDNKVKYSPKLRSFDGAYIKTKVTEKGNFQDVHLITEEEVENK